MPTSKIYSYCHVPKAVQPWCHRFFKKTACLLEETSLLKYRDNNLWHAIYIFGKILFHNEQANHRMTRRIDNTGTGRMQKWLEIIQHRKQNIRKQHISRTEGNTQIDSIACSGPPEPTLRDLSDLWVRGLSYYIYSGGPIACRRESRIFWTGARKPKWRTHFKSSDHRLMICHA